MIGVRLKVKLYNDFNGIKIRAIDNKREDNTMKSEKEKMIAGELYNSADVELVNARNLCRSKLNEFNRYNQVNPNRFDLLKGLLGSMQSTGFVEPPFYCDYGFNIHVGINFYANFNCTILDCCTVTIGDNCMLAPGVGIYTATHSLVASERNSGKEFSKPVTIKDNVWIGAQAIILPGVTVGHNVVIAAGSVVTKDIPDNVLVAGNPARIIKSIVNE
jgi:maltose O-acetyltransferase